MTFLSLPFTTFTDVQVVVRLEHGRLGSPPTLSVELVSSNNNNLCINDQQEDSLPQIPLSMNFVTESDARGPLLKIFSSKSFTALSPQGFSSSDHHSYFDGSPLANSFPPVADFSHLEDLNILRNFLAVEDSPQALSPESMYESFRLDGDALDDTETFRLFANETLRESQITESTKSVGLASSSLPGQLCSWQLPSPADSIPPSPAPRNSFCNLVPEMLVTPSPSSPSTPKTSGPESLRGKKGHTYVKRKKFLCDFPSCNRRFTSQYTLKIHTDSHKPKSKPSFPCTLGCQEIFSRRHDRLRHEVTRHGKLCEWTCKHCRRFFSSGQTFRNHKCPEASRK